MHWWLLCTAPHAQHGTPAQPTCDSHKSGESWLDLAHEYTSRAESYASRAEPALTQVESVLTQAESAHTLAESSFTRVICVLFAGAPSLNHTGIGGSVLALDVKQCAGTEG